jgi:hypothetical protein
MIVSVALGIKMRYKNGSAILVIIIIILIVAAGVLGYFFIQNKPADKIGTTSVEVVATPSPLPLPSSSPPAISKAVVVFEAEGSFSQTEKDEIRSKIINPYIDYYAELPDQTLLTITIAKNLLASKETYPYSAKTIFKNGGNSGFLIMKQGTGVAWWVPECLDGCNLSASFKAKYPEIASKVQ